MKRIAILLVMVLTAMPGIGRAFGIVGNGTTGEDSISISVQLTDSLGNAANIPADSFYVLVLGPSGDSIISFVGPPGTAGLHIDSIQAAMLGRTYFFAEAVAAIDGAGWPGVYELTFCAKSNSPAYINCRVCSFQLVNSGLDRQLAAIGKNSDSLQAILDTLRSQGDWVSSFDPENDTVLADIIKISGDPAVADNLEAILDNTGGVSVKFKKVEISGSNGTDQSLRILNSTGPAVLFSSLGPGSSDNGFEVSSMNGSGLFAGSVNGTGFKAFSTNSFDMSANIAGTITACDTNADGERLALDPENWDAADSAAYQGDASGLSVAAIADGVWDENQAAHNTAGTFGRYLDSPVSAAGSPLGTGSYPVTVSAYDSSTGQAVPGVRLSVFNQYLELLLAIGLTDNDGRAVFNLNAGDHILAATAPGYIFEAHDTMNVTGADNDTIFGYRFNPGSPALADLCRVYGFIHGIGGEPVEGVLVTAHLPDGVVRHHLTIISPYKQSVISDSTGYFHIDLIRSTDLTPSGAKYLISATYPAGTVLKKNIAVPDLTEWQLSW